MYTCTKILAHTYTHLCVYKQAYMYLHIHLHWRMPTPAYRDISYILSCIYMYMFMCVPFTFSYMLV